MGFVLGAGVDPAAERVDFAAVSRGFFESGGGIRTSGSSLVTRTISSLSSASPGDDRHRVGALLAVEPQVGLPGRRVGTVAGEAAVGEDRADVAVVRGNVVGKDQRSDADRRRGQSDHCQVTKPADATRLDRGCRELRMHVKIPPILSQAPQRVSIRAGEVNARDPEKRRASPNCNHKTGLMKRDFAPFQ